MEDGYIPGQCNIDAPGKRHRVLVGAIGVVVALFIGLYCLVAKTSPFWVLISFFPAWIGFLGFWQAANSFCVFHAAKGTYEVKGKPVKVPAQRYLGVDSSKARKIHVYSFLSALVFALVLFVVVYFS